jgi:hypothetical protein
MPMIEKKSLIVSEKLPHIPIKKIDRKRASEPSIETSMSKFNKVSSRLRLRNCFGNQTVQASPKKTTLLDPVDQTTDNFYHDHATTQTMSFSGLKILPKRVRQKKSQRNREFVGRNCMNTYLKTEMNHCKSER